MNTDPGCWFHGHEPIPEGAYRVCGECWHCYNTIEDLVAEENTTRAEHLRDSDWQALGYRSHDEMAQGLQPITVDQVDKILFCPLCTHDW